MPRIRYLQLRFDTELNPVEIPYFRAAVIEKSGRKGSLLHNHKGDTSYYYRYPLIQYKLQHGKAFIVCLNEGSDEIHYLLSAPDLDMKIGYKTKDFGIEQVKVNMFRVGVWEHFFDYSIINWLGLNEKRYEEFQQLQGDPLAQKRLLEKILVGNILAFAKGIGWRVEKQIKAEISEIKHIRRLTFKKSRRLAFDLHFRCNVSLPDYMGLGKGASTGFGVLRKLKNSTNTTRNEKPNEEE